MTVNRTMVLVGLVTLLLAAGVLAGRGVVTRELTASSAHDGVRWQGLPLDGYWQRTALAVWTNALLTDPLHSSVIWAGTNDGVWRSSDGGTTWRRAATGLRETPIVSLGATTTGDTVIAGGDDGTVYRGTRLREQGWSWQAINRPLGQDHPIFSVAPSAHGQVVLAGTFGSLYRGVSSRGRWAWQRVDHTQDAAVSAIVWLPWNPQRAFASVFGVRPAVISTQDGGRSWHPDVRGLPPTLPTQALLATSTPSHQLILTTMGGGVWRRDRTGTWQDMSAGLPARHAMPIVAVPGNGTAVLYAGTMGYGIYAKQGGSTWRRLGQGMMGGRYTSLGLAMALRPHPTLLVGTALGVFRYLPPHPHILPLRNAAVAESR
jgi:hypothetical protein